MTGAAAHVAGLRGEHHHCDRRRHRNRNQSGFDDQCLFHW
jgi:hypothetical protein